MSSKSKPDVRTLCGMGLISALAFVSMLIFRLPIEFLTYDPKDCLLAIGGLLYGPLPALGMAVVVAFLEMVTVSTTGPIGWLMNVLASSLFICPAALIYRRRRTFGGAIAGLAIGAVLMTVGMLFWDWLIVPLYMGVPREEVVPRLLPLFLPFNALKAVFNAVLTVLLYRSVVTGLRKARLFPESPTPPRKKMSLAVWLAGGSLLVGLVLLVLVWRGIL